MRDQRLRRQTQQRGYYTRLEAPSSMSLRELGVDSVVEHAADTLVTDHHPVPPALSLIAWKSVGALVRGHALMLTLVLLFMIKGPRFRYLDLDDDSVFNELLSLGTHGGPPCLTSGTLRRPHLHFNLQPAGVDPSDPLTALRNRLALAELLSFSRWWHSAGYSSCSSARSNPAPVRRSAFLAFAACLSWGLASPVFASAASGRLSKSPANGSTTNPGCFSCLQVAPAP